MRRAIVIAAIILTLWTGTVNAETQVSPDFCWGGPVDSLGTSATRLDPDILSETYAGMEFWMIPDDGYVFYGFFQKRLTQIMMVMGPDDLDVARSMVEAEYGEAFDEREETIFYENEHTLCMINFMPQTAVGITVYSKDLLDKYQTWLQSIDDHASRDQIIRFIKIRDTNYDMIDDIFDKGYRPSQDLAAQHLSIALKSYELGLESRADFFARADRVCPGWQSLQADPQYLPPPLISALIYIQNEDFDFAVADKILSRAYQPPNPKPWYWQEWGYWW